MDAYEPVVELGDEPKSWSEPTTVVVQLDGQHGSARVRIL